MPGTNIHRPGRPVPRKRGVKNMTVNSSGSRALKSRGGRPRIHGGYDPSQIRSA